MKGGATLRTGCNSLAYWRWKWRRSPLTSCHYASGYGARKEDQKKSKWLESDGDNKVDLDPRLARQ